MSTWLFSADHTQARQIAGVAPGISLLSLRETSTFDVANEAGGAGILGADSTPILEAINAATDGCQRISWVASDSVQVVGHSVLPSDLDTTKDVTLHTEIASASTTDAVGFTVDSFFDEGDTKVVDTSETNQTAAFADKTTTIAAADVPSGATKITVGLTPVAHTTDALYMTAIWLEYAKTMPGVEFNKADFLCARIMVPVAHRLVSAFMLTTTVVTTGTVEARLHRREIGDARGGALVGTKLENADLTPSGSISKILTRYDFVLGDVDKAIAPAFREYFLTLTATNVADRIEEPMLAIKYEAA